MMTVTQLSLPSRRVTLLVAAAIVLLVAAGAVVKLRYAHWFSDFDHPESVIHDPIADVYLVSNVNGEGSAVDGNGYISRMSTNGKILESRWIDGADQGVSLDAPKGMAIVGDVLFVADLRWIRRFDRRTGAPLGSIRIPGARSLNGVSAAPDGSIYVTDTGWTAEYARSGRDAVYRVTRDGVVHTLAKGTYLNQPNGVVATASGVYTVSWGNAELARIDASGQRTVIATLPADGLDGLVSAPGGGWFVSSWGANAVYRVDADGHIGELARGVGIPGIGLDAGRERLLLPRWYDGEVTLLEL